MKLFSFVFALIFTTLKLSSQVVYKENMVIALNGYYTRNVTSTFSKTRESYPEGNVQLLDYNDTCVLNKLGFFLVHDSFKKLKNLKSEYYAPVEQYIGGESEAFYLENESMLRKFILKKNIAEKEHNYLVKSANETFNVTYKFFVATVTYIIVRRQNLSLITENGIRCKSYSLIKILSLE